MRTFSSSDILSHPDKLLEEHIGRMLSFASNELEEDIIRFHDIGKIKEPFQLYIRDTSKQVLIKEHSLLSAYYFLLNSKYNDRDTLFGFLSILAHHGNIKNPAYLIENEDGYYLSRNFKKNIEFSFWDEVGKKARELDIYSRIETNIDNFFVKVESIIKYLKKQKFSPKFEYEDFIDFKSLYSNLLYADKYEAIFSEEKSAPKITPLEEVEKYISSLSPNKKRSDFREYVLKNFDSNHKLFTLTAPTGYGKTLTALNFALKFKKERIIYALPFTSIIDQTYEIIDNIYKENRDVSVMKVHHKVTINEDAPEDRYSKMKFLMESFSGDINITTLYQLTFALFGNKNKDNIKFNQLKNSVVIVDEAQAIPYDFRQDFIKLCQIISKKLNTVFIFMSATMPIIDDAFREISNLDYFKDQNRYMIKWLKLGEESKREANLIERVKEEAKDKSVLLVVNTITKAQELFLKFRDNYKTFCLNGYMYDEQKRDVIDKVKTLMNSGEKVLLVSTQSIEAGVDLDFDVGFRETSPISSIIQTAGRVNRHFGENQGILYLFDSVSKYEKSIYGNLQLISQNIIADIFKNREVHERDILEISNLFFNQINTHLEKFIINDYIKRLEFIEINKKIEEYMTEDYKISIIIEPYDGYISKFQTNLFSILNSDFDKFEKRSRLKNCVKELSRYSININVKEMDKIKRELALIKGLSEAYYLPYGFDYYFNASYGLKKSPDRNVEQAAIFS